MTIKRMMLYSIICFVILPILIMPFITSKLYENILEKKINASAQQSLTQIANSLEVVINNMAASSTILCSDKKIQEVLQKPTSNSSWDEVQNENQMQEKMANVLNTTLMPYSSNIIIIGNNGRIYSNGKKLSYDEVIQEKWYKDTVSIGGSISWLAPAGKYFTFMENEEGSSIGLARVIQDDLNGICGVLVITLDIQSRNLALFNFQNLDSSSGLYLISQEADIIYPKNQNLNRDSFKSEFLSDNLNELNGSRITDIAGRKMVVNYRTINKTGWKVFQMIPYDSLTNELKNLRLSHIFINLALMLILIIIAIVISTSIAGPLHKLSILMSEVPKGNFNVRMKVKGKSEIAQLGNSFNGMVKEMENLIHELQTAYQLREKARLEALQAQINPHFLFNTLNSIRWMATLSGAQNVSDMIAALTDLLDSTLYRKDEMIELSEEIQCLKNYVLLQKMRYGEKFDIMYELPEELQNYKVPILILQPLVENSIIHGFRQKDHGGIITIKGEINSEGVSILVTDNGRGMNDEVLMGVLDTDSEKKGKFNRIGLKNVHDRLQLLYGKEYGLVIQSREGEGTKIVLSLPKMGPKEELDA